MSLILDNKTKMQQNVLNFVIASNLNKNKRINCLAKVTEYGKV